MKVLYLSCHAILEYDELRLFESLGIDYFSLGSYIQPKSPVDPIRPALTREVDPDLLKIAPMRENMPREFIDKFDVIIVMHIPEWIESNWENIKHKRVIWRTIGQSTPAIEARIKPYVAQGLEILRYSPMEANIEGFAGNSGLIPFYKNELEFGPYTGENNEVITMAQNMIARGEFCHFDVFQRVTQGFNAHVYGPKNEEAGPLNGGFLTYEQLIEKYRKSRVYFYTGTQPASYTLNFIEAWMSGIPMVAVGSKIGNSLNIIGDTYQIPNLITNGVDGFVSDDYNDLRNHIEYLMTRSSEAERMSIAGRKKAISIFGMEVAKRQWADYLGISN